MPSITAADAAREQHTHPRFHIFDPDDPEGPLLSARLKVPSPPSSFSPWYASLYNIRTHNWVSLLLPKHSQLHSLSHSGWGAPPPGPRGYAAGVSLVGRPEQQRSRARTTHAGHPARAPNQILAQRPHHAATATPSAASQPVKAAVNAAPSPAAVAALCVRPSARPPVPAAAPAAAPRCTTSHGASPPASSHVLPALHAATLLLPVSVWHPVLTWRPAARCRFSPGRPWWAHWPCG